MNPLWGKLNLLTGSRGHAETGNHSRASNVHYLHQMSARAHDRPSKACAALSNPSSQRDQFTQFIRGVSTWEWVSIEAPNCAIAQSLMLPFYTPGRCPGPWPCCSSSRCSDDGRWWGWCSCQTRCEWSPEWEDLSQCRWRLLLRPISEP